MARSLPVEDSDDLANLHTQYQGISNQVVDLVILEYSGFNIGRLSQEGLRDFMGQFHLLWHIIA